MLNQACVLSLTATVGMVATGTPRSISEYRPVSRFGDIHLWLMFLPTPIITGSPRVIDTFLPNARVTDVPIILPGPIIPPGSSTRHFTI